MTERDSEYENGVPAKPRASDLDVQAAKALWDECKYRHDLVWKVVFQVTTAVVILSVAPYFAPYAVLWYLGDWIVAAPVLASVLVVFSATVVIYELGLLAKIRGPYWRLQKDQFGVPHNKLPNEGRILGWGTLSFVIVYFIGLAVLSVTNSVVCAKHWIY